MARNYRQDPDLYFLKELTNDELAPLVEIIAVPPEDRRITQTLTDQPNFTTNYKAIYQEIIHELQLFGGNTFSNMLRGGQGVLYKEILTDVCDRLKVKYNKKQSIDQIEMALLQSILEKSLDKLSESELAALANELGISTAIKHGSVLWTKSTFMFALQTAINLGGFKSYIIALKISNTILNIVFKELFKGAVKLGASRFAINTSIAKTISILSGPVGWVISGVWTALDLAGTAYRVTIPATIYISNLRLSYNAAKNLVVCSNGHANHQGTKFCAECGESLTSLVSI